MVEVFAFEDYRAFLKAYLDGEKQAGKSYRHYTRELGLNSPNYFQRLFEGKYNLSHAVATRLAALIGWNRYEERYFFLMLDLNNGRCDEPEESRREMERLRERAQVIHVRDPEIHSSLLHTVLLEFACLRSPSFTEDNASRALASFATPTQIKESLEFLSSKGYLQLDAAGVYAKTGVNFLPEQDKRNVDLQAKHRQFLGLARHRLNDAVEDREFQGLTIALDPTAFSQVKERVRRFVVELNEDFSGDYDTGCVYRLQFAGFKISR